MDDETRKTLGRIGEHDLELVINNMGLIGIKCKRHAEEGQIRSPDGCQMAIATWLAVLTLKVGKDLETFIKDVATR